MTTKLNRAKQKMRSWQREYHNLRKMVQAGRRVVVDGCMRCEYDEAEGGLVNHCDACCRKITTELYGLLVRGDMPPRSPRERRDDRRSEEATALTPRARGP